MNNGGCAQLCVDTIDSYYCTCNPGYLIPHANIIDACPGSCENFYADLIFLIDSSGSIRKNSVKDGYDNWELLLDFVIKMIDGVDVAHNKLAARIHILISYLIINFH